MTLPKEDITQVQNFHVYGRKKYPEPLSFVGQFQALDAQALKSSVLGEQDESGWVELIAFPASAVFRVIPREENG
jgi:hypothetical protein